MKIFQDRFFSDDDTTVSVVFVDSEFICFFIEDEYREHKVTGETRIPTGTYEIDLRTYGGFDRRYRDKYPDIHMGMLQLMDVPGFTDILIHVGNTDDNTMGCLLANSGVYVEEGNISGQSSVNAYKRFYEKVLPAALDGELSIEIVDSDMPWKNE